MRLSWRPKRFTLFPYLMIAAAVITLAAFVVYPLISLLLMSMRDYGTSTINFNFVGLEWFKRLPNDPRFVSGLFRTLVYSGSAVVGAMTLGTVMAFMLNRRFVGSSIVRTLFILPMVCMPVASALLWGTMFNPQQGILNYFLEVVGLQPSLWLASPSTALSSLVIVEVWMSSPLVMLIVLAGLKSMPLEPLESARIDGANTFQLLFHVILPMLQAALVAAGLITLIDTLKQFPIIWVLTQGGPVRSTETLYVYGYALGFQFFDLGYGAAVLVTLLILVVVVSLFVMRMRQRAWV